MAWALRAGRRGKKDKSLCWRGWGWVPEKEASWAEKMSASGEHRWVMGEGSEAAVAREQGIVGDTG